MANFTSSDREAKKDVYKKYFIAYCIGILLGYGMLLICQAIPGFPLGGPDDFAAFYAAGKMVHDGDSPHLYDLNQQSKAQKNLQENYGFTYKEGDYVPFYYPPFFALLFIPFTFITLSQGFIIWNLFNITLLITSVVIIFHHRPEASAKLHREAGFLTQRNVGPL